MLNPAPIDEHLKVLLLEDYPLDAELVKRELKSTHPNWLVQHVASKNAFIQALEAETPDVVISDYSIPQFNGVEAFLTIREKGLEIPFIMITGQLPEDSILECVKEGIDDYVIKSSLKRLSVAVDNALKRKRATHEKQEMEIQAIRSERKFKNIFNNAGVAICELVIPEMDRIMKARSTWRKASFEQIKNEISAFQIVEINDEMVNLFAATDKENLLERFPEIWNEDSLSSLRFVFRQLSRGSDQFEERFSMNTFEGGIVYVRFKAIQTSRSESRYILSFIDLTDVRRSENRLNKVISSMEIVVKQRTAELETANQKLQAQAADRERINQLMRDNYIHMTESIIAAKRIQQLMLPPKQSIADAFDDVFVYLRPKDIVSGDFYWFYGRENQCWISAVDCTGHGVPGAFMSMIGSNLLNQTAIENQTLHTSTILDEIDRHVIRELKQHEQGTEVSTGMDISLCSFDFDQMVMHYSGAFHQLYMIRNGELLKFKGDRFSLGGTFIHEGKHFSEHVIPIQKGDHIYMTTDGFMDQFGGPKDKKFTRRRFEELLFQIQGGNMYDQEMRLKSALQDWKGTAEQVDDILVIGMKI
ncbi:MAG: response regulator [Flavobacteriales bacterium]|nr:response regulator [Flavobacteriales bacterium]